MTPPNPMTQAELDRAKELAQKATPGEWYVLNEMLLTKEHVASSHGSSDLIADGRHWHYERGSHDLAYVAYCNPPFLLRLIADLEQTRAMLEQAQRERVSCIRARVS